MGLLDDLMARSQQSGGFSKDVTSALGELLKGNAPQPSAQRSNAPGPDSELLNGLDVLLAKLREAGLDNVVKSWIGTGPNAPVKPDVLGSALGANAVNKMAGEAGVAREDLLTQLAKALPVLIDKLTPDGRVPTQGELAEKLRGDRAR
jgi:uncharacterized protein YidB (DUF937 family)